MNFNNPFWPRHAFAFKGGSAPSAAEIPAPAAPPASSSSLEVQQARMDARAQARKKQGISSTILAGGGGGFSDSPQSPSGKTNLLGGG